MKGEPLDSLSKGYMKGGYGNYNNTMFEGYLNNVRSRKHSVGASVQHFASQGGINDVGYSGFSHNSASLFGKKFLKKHLLQGELNYDRDALRYYGYNPEEYSAYDKDNTKIINDILTLKSKLAKMLNYSDYASMSLETKMAKSSNDVTKFLYEEDDSWNDLNNYTMESILSNKWWSKLKDSFTTEPCSVCVHSCDKR